MIKSRLVRKFVHHSKRILFAICCLFASFFSYSVAFAYSGDSPEKSINHVARILFVHPSTGGSSIDETNDVASLRNSLFVAGFNITDIQSDKISESIFNEFNLIIIPAASAKVMNSQSVEVIKQAVTKGTNLVFDGVTQLVDSFHIRFLSSTVNINKIRDLQFVDNVLFWNKSVEIHPIDNSKNEFTTLCIDDTTKLPIAIHGNLGKGKFIYYSALFDPITDKGYSRFPYLIETLDRVFGIKQLAERRTSEMFYDAGMKPDTLSFERMAEQWRLHKIKRIYASGWYLKDSAEYDELIQACHANGIVVSCWLETPMISIDFWDKHPEWREKTAFLKDAQIDWRYLMNLADTNCRNAVFKELETLLMKHDWDGVNLAELYFEPSPVGPEYAQNFTPMNDVVRKEFKTLAGFDPVYLFDTSSPHYWKSSAADWRKFADYRKDLCFRLKTQFLDFLQAIVKRKSDFELMLTVIDVSLTPELSDNIGEDTQNALKLYAKYNMTLQAEDPSNCWGSTPDRYDKMGKFYRKYVKDTNQLVFDCNVVASHEKGYGGFPSEKPTGEEIRQIAYNMSLSNSRPTFYSEDAIFPNDFWNISSVLARDAKIIEFSPNIWKVTVAYTITLNIGCKDKEINLDGKPWMANDRGEVIIPAGEHKLEFCLPNAKKSAHLLLVSGELVSAFFAGKFIDLTYADEISSCYVTLDTNPTSIEVDGARYVPAQFASGSNRFTLKLPRGKHRVKIIF